MVVDFMDSLTQASLGAAVGHLCWQNKLGSKALLYGAVIGTIPDLDIIVYPFLDGVDRLYWHRGESHSILFMFLGAIATAWLLSKMLKEKKLSFSMACLGAFLIYATHILIDVFTIYGTQLLAPFSRLGFAFGNFFIIDPLFTLPLFIGIMLAVVVKHPWNIRVNLIGLVLAGSYALWSLSIQSFADQKFRVAAEKSGYEIQRHLTSAGALTTFLWRHVAETSDGFLLGYWSIFDKPDQVIEFHYIPKHADRVSIIQNSRTFAVVDWFSKGWWCVMSSDDTAARIVDLRFSEVPSGRGQPHQNWHWPFAWRFPLATDREYPLQSVIPQINDPLLTLNLLAQRITGGKGWTDDSANVEVSKVINASSTQ